MSPTTLRAFFDEIMHNVLGELTFVMQQVDR
jgi:hypothetical protein